jgi:hypothetical protein
MLRRASLLTGICALSLAEQPLSQARAPLERAFQAIDLEQINA